LSTDKQDGMLFSANIGDSGYALIRHQVPSDILQIPLTPPVSPDFPAYQSDVYNPDTPQNPFYVAHRGDENQHYFNAPFQLTVLPKTMEDSDKRLYILDQPEDAIRESIGPLQHGDILIMGTDGLFDNMYMEDILQIVEKEMEDVYDSSFERVTFASAIAAPNSPTSTYSPKNTFETSAGSSEVSWNHHIQEKMQHLSQALVKEAAMLAHSPRVSPFAMNAKKHGMGDLNGG
jgi:hypothetical protein